MDESEDCRIAVIGDRFMKPPFFVDALTKLERVCRENISTLELEWPDSPMVHGYKGGEFQGIKEFLGDRRELVRFLHDADILVNHLAPITPPRYLAGEAFLNPV
jgi:D-3-phosphoglycerate dehydrogenase